MSRSNNLYLDIIENDTTENKLELSIYYEEGGYNYYDSSTTKRGFYASTQAQNVSQREGGYNSVSYSMFGSKGYKVLLKEASRFNRNTLNKYNFNDPAIMDLIASTEKDYNLKVDASTLELGEA